MEQSRGGGFFWAKVSRGAGEHAQWEPVYRESAYHSAQVFGESCAYMILELGPRIPQYEGGLPKGVSDGE